MGEKTYSQARQRQIRQAKIKARKRRRMKKRIIRDSVLAAMLIVFILIIYGIGSLISFIFGGNDAKQVSKEPEETTEQIVKVQVDKSALSSEYLEYYNEIEAMEDKYPEVMKLYENFADYPENLLELVIRNPETVDFVKDYPTKHDVQVVVDISKDYTMGEIPLLLQWDERWGYAAYGDNIIAINGCGPTCASMVAVGLTGNTNYNPKYVAELSEQQGYYTESGTSWSLMIDGISKMGVNGYTINITADSIKSELKLDHPIIASMGPGDFTKEGHFIVLKGLDKKGKVIINDPNSKIRSEKHWDVEVLLSQIKSMWAYTV